LDRIPPICIYEAMAKDKRRPEPAEFNFKFQPYIVDKDKISNDNVLIPFLERYNGIMSAELMDSFVAHLLENGLNDYKLQRNFRNSIIEIIKINQPATEEIKQWPIYNYLLSSEEEIKSKFITIFESFLKMDGRSIELISEEEKFTTAYGVLDFFPAFKEKIEKKNNMRNMLTDALHVYIASHCSYFICGDTSSIKKAKLIYQAFNIKTRVYHVDDFINKVEI
jgi:hypothetical protein